jgi:hypothetical protein
MFNLYTENKTMLRTAKPKDLKNFVYYCQHRDSYSDFYVTKNNKRLYLTNIDVAKEVFIDCMKYGNKCYIKEENNEIKAVMIIIGFKDKFPRKYIKVLSKSKDDFKDLFAYLQWQELKDLFIKVRNTNKNFVKYDEKIKRYKPSYILRKSGFQVIAVRDREVLLKKEDNNRGYRKYNNKRN